MISSGRVWRRRLEPYLLILPAALFFLLVIAFPLGYNLVISLFKWNASSPVRTWLGLKNYQDILQSNAFLTVLSNTIIWTVCGVASQMLIGLLLALIVNSLRRGQGLLRSVFMLPWILPGVVVCLIWSWMLQADLGIINGLLRQMKLISSPILWLGDKKYALFSVIAVNTWKAFPFWFITLLAGLQNLPEDQLEAARIDGANGLATFLHIKLPHLLPVISTTGVVTTMWTLNYFDLIFIMTNGGPGRATSTMPVYTYLLGFQSYKYGQSAAMAILSLILMALLCIPYVRTAMRFEDN